MPNKEIAFIQFATTSPVTPLLILRGRTAGQPHRLDARAANNMLCLFGWYTSRPKSHKRGILEGPAFAGVSHRPNVGKGA
jgi:hypothetical protein